MSMASRWKRRSLHYLQSPVSLRWALTVPFLLLMVGATTLVAYLSNAHGREAIEDLGHQLTTQTNQQVTQELKSYLYAPLLINRLNRDLIEQGYLNPQDIPALEAALFHRLQQFEQVSAVLFVNPQGTLRFVERFPHLYLGVADPPNPDRIRIYRLDDQGKRGAIAHEVKGLDVRRDRPFYRLATTTGELRWNPISRYGNTNALTLKASQPVYDRLSRQLLGVFAVDVRLKYLSEFLRRLVVHQPGQIIITDQNGALIATSTDEQPYLFVDTIAQPNQVTQLPIEQSQNGLTRSLGTYLRHHSPGLATLTQPQLLHFRYRGKLHYVQITPLHDQHGLNWRVITVIPRSYVVKAIQGSTHTTILLYLLTLGGAIAVGLLTAQRLIARFTQLSLASHELAAGNLSQRLLMNDSIAEFNDLAYTLNQMADQIHAAKLKQVEQALKQSEASLLQAQQIAHLGSWDLNLATQKLSWSEELFHIMGIEPAQTEPSRAELLTMIPEEDREILETAVKRALLEGTPYEVEHRIRRPDGSIRYVISKGQSAYQDQQIVKLYGTALDITERKQVEIALQQSENRFQQLASASPSMIYTLVENLDGPVQFEYVSPAFESLYEIPVAIAMQDAGAVAQQIHQEDRAAYRQAIAHSIATMQPFRHEWRIITPSGKVKWLQAHSQPQRREDQIVWHGVISEVTYRKQVEAALQEGKTHLSLAQQVAQVGTWEWDLLADQRTWSEMTYCHWGRDPALGPPGYAEVLHMVHPDDRTMLQVNNQMARDRGIPYSLDLRVVHPDGSIRYLDSRAEPLFDDRGRVIKLIGTSLDITERKQTEQKLQEREAMLRAIGDNLHKGFIYQRVYEPGKGFYYSYISAGIERLLSLKPEAVLENPAMMRTVGFDEDLVLADQVVKESFNNLTPIELQMRNRTPEGQIQWSSIRSVPRRLEDGRIVWDGIEVDITDLKHTEAALRDSEERFRRAFDDAPIGISLVLPTGQFVRVNSSYCNLVGYAPEELLTLRFQDITHPEDLNADLQGFEQMLSGEITTFHIQKRFITRQGVVIPVLLNAAPTRNEAGEVLYVVEHIQDIRARLAVERMKDEFISVVSHELRTPLTSIRGSLGILESGVFHDRPERAQQMLRIAVNNSERLVRLVNDILTLERLQSGNVSLAMERCRVGELMQQAIDSVQPLADQSNIVFSVTPVSTVLIAAPDAIVQTLTNLLSNAVKFSTPGSTIWLQAELRNAKEYHATSDANLLPSHIVFAVKDQGRGIPADKLETIFEQFQQVDVSDSRQKGGTGLGLTICKRIVQKHGGRIWVESVFGEGSTFYFTLPLEPEITP